MRLALDFGLCKLFRWAWEILIDFGRRSDVGVAEVVAFVFKNADFLFNFSELHHNIVSGFEAFSFNFDADKVANEATFFSFFPERRWSILLSLVLFLKGFVLFFKLFYLLFKALYFTNK